MTDLRQGIRVRVGPATECEIRPMAPDVLATIQVKFDAPLWPEALDSAEYDERLESVLRRAIGIFQTVLEWMLGR